MGLNRESGQGYSGTLTRPSATLSQRERGCVWDGTPPSPRGRGEFVILLLPCSLPVAEVSRRRLPAPQTAMGLNREPEEG